GCLCYFAKQADGMFQTRRREKKTRAVAGPCDATGQAFWKYSGLAAKPVSMASMPRPELAHQATSAAAGGVGRSMRVVYNWSTTSVRYSTLPRKPRATAARPPGSAATQALTSAGEPVRLSSTW